MYGPVHPRSHAPRSHAPRSHAPRSHAPRSHARSRLTALGAGLLLFVASPGHALAQTRPWPAESEQEAQNLTKLSRDFREDLSGAVWNPVERCLWVCRNGPGEDSRLWKLVEDESGSLVIAREAGRELRWDRLGDCEGVTLADPLASIVYVLVEDQGTIHELDVSTPGETRRRRVYDTSHYLAPEGSLGAEGITFVPDAALQQGAFLDARGQARASRGGLGGLMFVGHQRDGSVFAFDLDPRTGAVELVGEYRVREAADAPKTLGRVVALEFDAGTGKLLLWHGLKSRNVLSVVDLTSIAVEGAPYRALRPEALYEGPSDRSYEGLALVPVSDCEAGARALYLTIDDGKKRSLLRFADFSLGCGAAQESDEDRQPDRVLK